MFPLPPPTHTLFTMYPDPTHHGLLCLPPPPHPPARAQSTVLSEADRAAGTDPGRQHEHDSATLSLNPLVTSASFNPTPGSVQAESRMAAGGMGGSTGTGMGDSSSSFGGSDVSWAHKASLAGGGGSGGALLPSGPSGRTLGNAAAALGEDNSSGREATAGSDFGGTQSALSYRTDDSGAQSTSTLAALEAKAEAEAYEAELAASSGSGAVGSGSIGGPAVAAAAAAGLPPSGRSTSGRSSGAQSTAGGGVKSSGPSGAASSSQRSRAESSGSHAEELRELTDQERQLRMEESDAARAASLLRGSSFKVPLQPDLERAITEEEQERRRQAVQAVEESRAPVASEEAGDGDGDGGGGGGAEGEMVGPSPAAPSPPKSLMGKMASGLGIGRFFGMGSPTTAEDGAEPTADADFKAGPAEDAAAGGEVGAEYVPVTGEGAVVGAESVGPAVVPPADTEGAAAAAVGATAAGVSAIGAAAAADRQQKAGAPSQEEGTAPAAGAGEEPVVEGSLSPEQARAYSENIDRTLEVRRFLGRQRTFLSLAFFLAMFGCLACVCSCLLPKLVASSVEYIHKKWKIVFRRRSETRPLWRGF